MLIPDELNDDLRAILGMVPWTSGPIAHALRAAGAAIKPKMEDEQAATLHWLLGIYAAHGTAWRKEAGGQLQAKRAAIAKATTA